MDSLQAEHRLYTRRFFLNLVGLAGAGALWPGQAAAGPAGAGAPPEAIEYLTAQEMFGTVERGDPLPYTLAPERLAKAGLTPETWRLNVVSDPRYPASLDRELRHRDGTALRFGDLLALGERRAVRFLKTLTCANGAEPLGTGLWEGVPLRDVLWRTGLKRDCRRVFYQGYHNADAGQLFRSSLPLDRVLEDPLGVPPVILAYKLNGEPIAGKRGGPVRMIVPESYSFKSVKWLNLVVLSNRFTSNDTYAIYNNTTESWMKTLARFGSRPGPRRAHVATPLTGIAQVGTAGLKRVQVVVLPGEPEAPADDAFFEQAAWRDATLLDAPEVWGGRLPAAQAPGGGRGVPAAFGFPEATGRPKEWPQRFTTVHWATRLEPLPPGRYTALCRTIDRDGYAQPWPRPLQNSGRNKLHRISFDVGA